MNVDVLHRLREAVAERGPGAYVLTVSNDGRPHAVYVNVVWSDGRIVAEVGNTTAANAKARPEISLLFSVRGADDYSLFVDGRATVESSGDVHRPGRDAHPCGFSPPRPRARSQLVVRGGLRARAADDRAAADTAAARMISARGRHEKR